VEWSVLRDGDEIVVGATFCASSTWRPPGERAVHGAAGTEPTVL